VLFKKTDFASPPSVKIVCEPSLASFPWQNVLAVVPKVPVFTTPEVVVIRGRLAVAPTAPALVIFPCVWEVGVLESVNLESLVRARFAVLVIPWTDVV
jgi:hypothetical protein